jgi:toxin ParE1/3/4
LKAKPVIARAQANHDIDEIIACYLGEPAEQAAYGFVDALEDAFTHIGFLGDLASGFTPSPAGRGLG